MKITAASVMILSSRWRLMLHFWMRTHDCCVPAHGWRGLRHRAYQYAGYVPRQRQQRGITLPDNVELLGYSFTRAI